jgi:hypothetical protein
MARKEYTPAIKREGPWIVDMTTIKALFLCLLFHSFQLPLVYINQP